VTETADLRTAGVRARARRAAVLLAVVLALTAFLGHAAPATAQTPPPETPQPEVSIDIGSVDKKPSSIVVVIVLITLIAVAPALLLMMTSFTRIIVVLGLLRNALGIQQLPPNQVVVGLALFLKFFVMGPTLKIVNETALQPMLHGEIDQSEAMKRAEVPIKTFMLDNTRPSELGLFVDLADQENGDQAMPEHPEELPLTVIVPAFVLSELKTAFIIGFVIFIPFLVIDMLVSSTLMSMGMMMLPPVLVSLPFKILLFVVVDGWTLVVESLVRSFNTG